jgi:hypothetical protein
MKFVFSQDGPRLMLRRVHVLNDSCWCKPKRVVFLGWGLSIHQAPDEEVPVKVIRESVANLFEDIRKDRV